MRFNEYLKESNARFETDPEKIKELMIANHIHASEYGIRSNGVVDVMRPICIPDNHTLVLGGKFNVQFGVIHGTFDCSSVGLTSLEGAPRCVDGVFECGNNRQLTSLKFAPRSNGGISCWSTNITTLVGIADLFEEINGDFEMHLDNVTQGGLGLIMIPKLTSIIDMTSGVGYQPFKIIQKYLGRPDDIFECQAELIENGFEEYAQL